MQIGIDLGGTFIKGGLVDQEGAIREMLSLPTKREEGYHQVVGDLIDLIKKLLPKAAKVEGIGIGIPGIVSQDGEMILSCPNLHWKNKPLKADLERALNLKIFLINDASAATIGEARFGSGRGKKSLVMLTLGTGIGGGIIIDHQLLMGSHGLAGELGHTIVGENFYNCSCGKNGCLETFSSVTALIKYCQMRLENTDSVLEKVRNLNGIIIFEAAEAGDGLAIDAVERMCHYLGIAISNINDLLDPDVFIIGGGLAAAGSYLLDGIQDQTKKKLTYPHLVEPEIRLASLGNQAGIIGASKFVGGDQLYFR